MKVDLMTTVAVGFAAFAAWYVLKPKAATTSSAADTVWGMATAQRQDSGNAQWQNSLAYNNLVNGLYM